MCLLTDANNLKYMPIRVKITKVRKAISLVQKVNTKSSPKKMSGNWEEIKEYLPLSFLRYHQIIKQLPERNLENVIDFYGTVDLKGSNLLRPVAGFNSVNLFKGPLKVNIATISWLHVLKNDAADILASPFTPILNNGMIHELNQVFYENQNTTSRLKAVLLKFGIKLVLIKQSSEVCVSRAVFWSNNNPCIGISLTNQLDALAYELFRGLWYVFFSLNKKERISFLNFEADDQGSEAQDDEVKANNFAKKQLVASSMWDQILEDHFSNLIRGTNYFNRFTVHNAILIRRFRMEINSARFGTYRKMIY